MGQICLITRRYEHKRRKDVLKKTKEIPPHGTKERFKHSKAPCHCRECRNALNDHRKERRAILRDKGILYAVFPHNVPINKAEVTAGCRRAICQHCDMAIFEMVLDDGPSWRHYDDPNYGALRCDVWNDQSKKAEPKNGVIVDLREKID